MYGSPGNAEPSSGVGLSGTARVTAPAKVNLALLVGPPSADGYHPLFTVFMPIDLADDLVFDMVASPPGSDGGDRTHARRPGVRVECPGVPAERNLILRALEAVTAETGWVFSGSVIVRKSIPTGAGLGGGSSNAARTLQVAAAVVAERGGDPMEPATLARLARALGADVPFFLDPRPSLARGAGERLCPVSLPELPVVLVLPEEELSTAEVYRTYDGVAGTESASAFEARCRLAEQAWRTLEQAWLLGELTLADFCVQVASLMQNDLERASLHLSPALAARLASITRRGALAAMMSGSGPSLFGLCASEREARQVASALSGDGMRARVTRAGASA